jgi:hypothetical protein
MNTKVQKMLAAKKTSQKSSPQPQLMINHQSQSEAQVEDTSILSNPLEADGLDFSFADDPDFQESSDLAGEAGQETGPVVLSKDEFWQAFKVMHQAPNLIPIPPFPMKSLPIADAEQDGARMASDSIYDIAAETAWLRWMIEPQSLWMQRAVVIASYAIPKAMAITAELRAKQARPVDDVVRDAPQPTPHKPVEPSNATETWGRETGGL